MIVVLASVRQSSYVSRVWGRGVGFLCKQISCIPLLVLVLVPTRLIFPVYRSKGVMGLTLVNGRLK